MKKILVLTFCFVGIIAVRKASGQVQIVKILKIEVDSRTVDTDFQLFIHKDGKKILPKRDGQRGFEVPEGIRESPVEVQVIFDRYDLWFSPVYRSKFSTNWIVGVDTKPFDKENLQSETAADVKQIYYLQFVSDEGDDTRLVVTVKKKKKQSRE
jgi:hypothetical protein